MSGQVARAWHRRRRDRRLGYSALGLGAGGFVLVLAGTLVVTEVVPGLLDDEPPPAQRVVPSAELEPDTATGAGTDGDEAPAAPVGPVSVVAVDDGVPDQGAQPVADQPDGSGSGGTPSQPGSQPEPQPQPQTQPEPDPQPDPPRGQGAVSALLDPVVQGVTGVADGLTGGATAPVTGPVNGVVDGVSDVVDGLLDLQ
jgi:hypothetical protein